jgi:hypothetical protein
MYKAGSVLTLAAALLALPSLVPRHGAETIGALAAEQAAYKLRTFVMGSAGAPAHTRMYKVNGTLGQPTPIGIGDIASNILYAGFWGRYWALTPVDEPPLLYRNEIFQNYPNPFNPATIIEYSIASAGLVEIAIFNVDGQKIRTLVGEVEMPGTYRARWDGKNDRGVPVASGIYFYRLKAGSFCGVKKMLLLR